MLHATGAILIGGKSLRMGTDKALLRLDNRTILERSVIKMQAIFSEVIIVGGDKDKYHVLNARTISDIHQDCGPLGGIHTALLSATYDYVFISACDMPFWGTGLARFLLESCVGHDGAVPAYNSYYEPLLAVYSKSCLPAIEDCLNQHQYKVSGFFANAKINFVEKSLLELVCKLDVDFYNINTIEDLNGSSIRHHLGSKPVPE